jgi:biotin carboxyl carrier protein
MGIKYLTWLGGEEATVEILSQEGQTVVARIGEGTDAREITFDRASGSLGAFHVLEPSGAAWGGRVTDTSKGEQIVRLGAFRVPVKVVSERDAWMGGGTMDEDEGTVRVAMPGLVVKLLVAEGDAVVAGQPVLIVEAMKMENEVKAGRDGIVEKFHVAEGESVEADAVLAEIGDA